MTFRDIAVITSLVLLTACSAHTVIGNYGPSGTHCCSGECTCSNGIADRVFYNFNAATLTKKADSTLDRQAAWLVKYPTIKIIVAGNADERGTETYNLALGQDRANTARDYLVADGVAASRVQTISYGKDCQVAAGNDDASYQQNRNAITSVQGFNPQNCH